MTETWGEEAQNSLLSFAPFTFLANDTHHSDQPCPRPRVSFHIFRKLQSIVWRGEVSSAGAIFGPGTPDTFRKSQILRI